MLRQASDHFDGERFFNPGHARHESFLKFLRWQLTSQRTAWPRWINNQARPKLDHQLDQKEVAATFVNHATVLLQLSGMTVITDPVFSERVSPFKKFGPKRVRDVGVKISELPSLDVVLISHNHYDHLDEESIKELKDRFDPLFLVALGDEQLLKQLGVRKVLAMDWWDSHKLGSTSFHFLPSLHWSGRWIKDRYRSLWGSFWIKHNGLDIYFAGDTGYSEHFRRIRSAMGSPFLSLLPIGAYEPRWFMRAAHMNPEEAVQAHLDLGSSKSMGIHFGTFQLTDEGIDRPLSELRAALDKKELTSEAFFTLEVGETRKFSKTE